MFKALYRKYRPKSFKDVVGQKHIVSVLENAISQNKIAHAYLFYGPRGTGKTSIAKIFANEVNSNEQYLGDSVDILEIDAASNNGVDEIRDIKEAIKFAPTESKYKVYIIDEVHMLTTSAFNALLKTLEEPPAHIIFILATTEMHKIPATILSRCQKFEFKNITNSELQERLENIAKLENINIDTEAIRKIATIAKGGLRDAIGILDQVSNYNIEKITLEDVLNVTSSLSDTDILDFYRLILERRATDALISYNTFVQKGKDTKILLTNLITLSRDIVIFKNMGSDEFCEYNLEGIKQTLENVSTEDIYDNILILSETENSIRFSTEYISYMQICIMKLSNNSAKKNINNYVPNNQEDDRIKNLENKISLLEQEISFLKNNSKAVSSNEKYSSKTITKLEDTSITLKDQPLIIPGKKAMIKIIDIATPELTEFANNCYTKIIEKLATINTNMYEIFREAKLEHSSKEGCILIFDNQESMFKVNSDDRYLPYLETLFSKALKVPYKVYILQRTQYESFIKDLEGNVLRKEEITDVKEIREEKTKIEQLFSEIITEE